MTSDFFLLTVEKSVLFETSIRKNIVISRDETYNAEGIEVVSSPELALKAAGDIEEVMIIGGGHIYEIFLPECSKLYLTHIDLDVAGADVALSLASFIV